MTAEEYRDKYNLLQEKRRVVDGYYASGEYQNDLHYICEERKKSAIKLFPGQIVWYRNKANRCGPLVIQQPIDSIIQLKISTIYEPVVSDQGDIYFHAEYNGIIGQEKVMLLHEEIILNQSNMDKEHTEKEKTYAVMVEGKQTTAKTYADYPQAEAEARRLALHERKTTYVMQAITKIELNDVKITSIA